MIVRDLLALKSVIARLLFLESPTYKVGLLFFPFSVGSALPIVVAIQPHIDNVGLGR
jgi:hypothetical protein